MEAGPLGQAGAHVRPQNPPEHPQVVKGLCRRREDLEMGSRCRPGRAWATAGFLAGREGGVPEAQRGQETTLLYSVPRNTGLLSLQR